MCACASVCVCVSGSEEAYVCESQEVCMRVRKCVKEEGEVGGHSSVSSLQVCGRRPPEVSITSLIGCSR